MAKFFFRCLTCFLFCLPLVLAAQTSPPKPADFLNERIIKLEQQIADAKTSGDNGWMLMCSALVLLMTGPGLALFYGGLVRKKMCWPH